MVEWWRGLGTTPSGGLVTWERMGESEMTRRIYKGGVDAVGVRGRSPCIMGGQIAGVLEGEGG